MVGLSDRTKLQFDGEGKCAEMQFTKNSTKGKLILFVLVKLLVYSKIAQYRSAVQVTYQVGPWL